MNLNNEFILPKAPQKTLCTNCNKVPKITILQNGEYYVNIKCDCSFNSTILLTTYLKHLSTKKLQELNNKCINHRNKECEYYCGECKKELCSECYLEHKKHWCSPIPEFLLNQTIQKINENINRANNHLMVYNKQLKNNLINEMNLEIRNLEFAYKKNLTNNCIVLHFINLLKINYTDYLKTYNSAMNLYNNSHFVLNSLEQNDKNTIHQKLLNLHQYYKKDYVIKCDYAVKQCDLTTLKLDRKFDTKVNQINNLLILHDKRLAACSNSSKIFIYDIDKRKLDITIRENLCNFKYMTQLKNCILAVADANNRIHFYVLEKNSYSCLHVLSSHTNTITKIEQLPRNRFATASLDNSIKIYNSEFPFQTYSKLENDARVLSLLSLQNKNVLLSVGHNNVLRFWDLSIYRTTQRIHDVFVDSPNGLYQIDNNRIVVSNNQMGKLAIISIKSFQVESYIINPFFYNNKFLFKGVTSFLKVDSHSLLIGCPNGGLALLNINSFKCVATKEKEGNGFASIWKDKLHDGNVLDMVKISDNSFASCSINGEIKIWSYNDIKEPGN